MWIPSTRCNIKNAGYKSYSNRIATGSAEVKMNNINAVIMESRRLEMLLKAHYHAQGNTLQELVESSRERLPSDVISKLSLIASIQYDAIDEKNNDEFDVNLLITKCKECEKELLPRSNRTIWGIALFLIFSVTAGAIWFYIENWHYIAEL